MSIALRRLALVVAAVSLVGCHSYKEQFEGAGITGSEGAPEWVRGKMPTDETSIYFVGRGLAHNVLDEKAAYSEAVRHAHQQLAMFMANNVDARMRDFDNRAGAPFLPPIDQYERHWRHRSILDSGRATRGGLDLSHSFNEPVATDVGTENDIGQHATVMTGDLVPVNEYWERWTVGADTPGVFTPSYDHAVRHYKCWVLMVIPRDRVDSRVRAALAAAQSRLAETSARLAFVEAENAACQAEKNCGRVISVRGR